MISLGLYKIFEHQMNNNLIFNGGLKSVSGSEMCH